MGRPRSFDRDDVLDRAVELFWRKGYDAATVQDLTAATGLRPGSLYGAFGDKHALFLAAVDRYVEQVVIDALSALNSDNAPRMALHAFFEAVVDGILTGRRRWGCLMTNSAVERAARDPAVAAKVAANIQRIEDAFRRVVEAGQARGEFSGDLEPRATARLLTCVLQGLNVIARTAPDRQRLDDIVASALAVVE